MDTLPAPTLENELPTGLYSEEEKGQILARIEAAAGAGRMTVDSDVFKPRKRGILFPVVVNIFAVGLIVGAWFAADSYFQTRQQGLSLRTDKLFSAESKLLAKVLEDAKAQMAAANAEIEKIQGDLQKAAADKADLQRSFDERVAAQDRALRKELADSLAAEKKRLQAEGLGAAEITKRLAEFETAKNLEFTGRLDTYRKQAQAEIDQRTIALTTLQAKLQTTVSEQDKLRQEIDKQTKEREGALQSQLSSQSADLDALKKDRDDLNAFYRQADNSLVAIKASFETRDWTRAQSAVDALRQVLNRGSASASEAVRIRAQAQSALADSFDAALSAIDATGKSETSNQSSAQAAAQALAQLEAARAQAKKELAAANSQASTQLAEGQQSLAASEEKWRQAAAEADALRTQIADLVAKLDGSTTDANQAHLDAETLIAKVAELQQTIAQLTPYKEQTETLSKLFAANYPTAEDRFKTTFGSPTGAALFPQFDTAWEDLAQQIREANNAQATRKRALDEVLAFTTYLRGLSTTPTETRDAATKLARTDEDYRKVVDAVQALAAAGITESSVKTAATQLYGTVAAVSGTKVVLEPLTKVRPAVGDIVELRRAQGKKETVLGRGPVLTATNTKIEIDWTGNSGVPLSGDAAYLVLP